MRDVKRGLLHTFGIAVLALGVWPSCVCEEAEEPCLDWVELGDTYTVELVQRIDFGLLNAGSIRGPDPSCGVGFDLSVGDTIKVKATTKRTYQQSGCGPDCYEVNASVEIPGVEIADTKGRQSPQIIGNQFFRQEGHATLGGGCHGDYQIGIESIDSVPKDPTPPSGFVATDHLLYRGFLAYALDPCVVDGSVLPDLARGGVCSDAWAVRIRDVSGRVVTRDFKMPPPQALDASMTPLDASMTPSDIDDGSVTTDDTGVGDDTGVAP